MPLTAFTNDRPRVRDQARSVKTPSMAVVTACAVAIASGLTVLMFWPRLLEVWAHGTFFDSDDAMRLVQVRALLAGQSWFDMTAYGLDPPSGSSMHWSRTVDVPIALLIDLFGIATNRATAEILARLAFPALLLLGLFAGVARLADALLGSAARVPAIVATLFCGCAVVQFQPGRIDHHAPQIVTLVFMVAAALAALDPAKARQAAWAGALAALSLSISLENLPFIVSLSGMLVAVWVWHGPAMDRMLRAFAAGLAGGLTVAFLATVAPDRWFASVCDAYGAAHLGAGLIGAAGCLALSLASARLRSRGTRLPAAGGAAGLVVAYVALAYPICLHDPFAAVDPLVREVWILNVSESQPLTRFFRQNETSALLYAMPVVLGLAGCLGAALALRGTTALRFGLIAVLTTTGLAMGFWQIRVFTSVTPLAICGALPLAVACHDRFLRAGRDLAAVSALCLVFPFTSLAWALVLPDHDPPGRDGADCRAASAFASLTALPPGSVVAPIDAGAFLLAHTTLSVFAAPYHRDNDGNRFMLEAFMAKPDAAVAMLAARHVGYVMTCPGLGETRGLAERAPYGLAASLLAGHPPAGLVPVPLTGTPYSVFRVAPATN